MSNYYKGKNYEDYIEFVYRLLLDLETNRNQEPIIISRNVILSKNGYTGEIDIYYEFRKANILHRVAIECKNHNHPIKISSLRDFFGKITDFHNITGVFVSDSGFQSGAVEYAKEKGIIIITTDDLPNFLNLIGLRLKQLFLPNKFAIGEPFYVLMETNENGELNGSYHCIQINNNSPLSIMLFLSKKHAQDFIKRNEEKNLVVRGLLQETFDYMTLFAKNIKAEFQIILKKENERGDYVSFFIKPEELKEQYLEK